MRDKILLKVLLPANRQTYEFWVPMSLRVRQGAWLISRILGAQERARYCASDDCDLMYAEGVSAGRLLAREDIFGSLAADDHIVDGSLLVLM